MDKVISVENVNLTISSGAVETVAVRDVSMDIYSESVTVVMGQSGCGKSSLLNVIGGMKSPTSGRVIYKGEDIVGYSDRDLTRYRRDEVGFVFQNYNLISSLTAIENVNVAAALSPCNSSSAEILGLVGLKGMEDKYPRQLSGGEQQRVCIARALVKNAGLLLCDEPTGALDTGNARNIIVILQDLAREMKLPVVIVTHNLDLLKVADHYVIMENGSIIEEVFNDHPADARDVF